MGKKCKLSKRKIATHVNVSTLGFIREKQQNKKGIRGFKSDWQRQK